MDAYKMLLNYLEISKFLVIFFIMLLALVIIIILYIKQTLLSGEMKPKNKKSSTASSKDICIFVKESKQKAKQRREDKIVKIKGFHQNEIIEAQKKFYLGEKTENVDHLSRKLANINTKNNIIEKNDELSIMFVESLSSLNSWKNNEVEGEIFKEVNWNLEKHEEENEDESLVYQYIFPQARSSQYSTNSNFEPEDGEEKEEELLSAYKLGICRIFEENENNLKTNIVKEVHGSLFKIYSEGNPEFIKEKCRKDTIPGNFNEILGKYKEKGYEVLGLAGKKMKMNYIQSQKIERSKCESNMIFLGFAIYKIKYEGYKSAYS